MVDYVGAYASDHHAVFIDWNQKFSPWINEQELRKKGALFMWSVKKDLHGVQLPPAIAKRFPHAQFKGVHYFSQLTKANVPRVNMAYAILPPENRDF